jgi:hypothetical protein
MILEEQCPILPRWHVAVQTATADLSLSGGKKRLTTTEDKRDKIDVLKSIGRSRNRKALFNK